MHINFIYRSVYGGLDVHHDDVNHEYSGVVQVSSLPNFTSPSPSPLQISDIMSLSSIKLVDQ